MAALYLKSIIETKKNIELGGFRFLILPDNPKILENKQIKKDIIDVIKLKTKDMIKEIKEFKTHIKFDMYLKDPLNELDVLVELDGVSSYFRIKDETDGKWKNERVQFIVFF